MAPLQSLPVVISRRVLVEQTWHVSAEGLRIEEPGRPPMVIERSRLAGFGLPRTEGGASSYLVVGHRAPTGAVEPILVPVLDGTIHAPTQARALHEALRRTWPELDLGWHALSGPELHARLGVVLSLAGLAPIAIAVVVGLVVAVVAAALWLR